MVFWFFFRQLCVKHPFRTFLADDDPNGAQILQFGTELDATTFEPPLVGWIGRPAFGHASKVGQNGVF